MPNTNGKARKGKAYFRGALLLPTTVTALNTTHSKIMSHRVREEYIFLHPKNDRISSNLKFCEL